MIKTLIPLMSSFILPATALELPNVLGSPPAKTKEEWLKVQRPATLELFKKHVYGRAPVGKPDTLAFKVLEEDPKAMDGAATLKIIQISYSGPGGESSFKLITFIPNKATKPAPGYLLICNRGPENIDPTRKQKDDFWPAESIVARGYVAATFFNGELSTDKDLNFNNGAHKVFDNYEGERPGDAWATIAAWAWGASRALDYFETDPAIDATKFAVVGHSRGGKTALWAGANDERFALTISNNSGCTGAAIARRKHGERVARINKVFPHWFCGNYKNFDEKEDALPVDQHQLVALMAPRAVYVASASKDDWADPEGEFLAAVHASPVYKLFGLKGLETTTFPEPNSPIQIGQIGYHLRSGKHDLTDYDWEQYLNFGDKHLK
ncbi:acetylxylan esterase [Akkermansiaceae bacterium]|nr:acetylxylan esterase [Akkermansiaceae bacterium]